MEIINFFNFIMNNLEMSLMEISIAFAMLIITIASLYYNRKTQRDNLFHNLSLERIKAWEKKPEENDKIRFERIINFYEYVAFLILRNKINKKDAKELFSDDIKNIFKKWGKEIIKDGNWKEIIDINNCWTAKNKKKQEFSKDKNTIKKFLNEHSLNLVALSVFLLVSITLSSHSGLLSHPLGVLSAGISYFLLIDIIKKDDGRDSFTLGIMKSFIFLFAIVFCIWVILNLVLPSNGISPNFFDNMMLVLWLLFIIGIPFKINSN